MSVERDTMKTEMKMIADAFERLQWVFDASWTNHAERLLALCEAEEREHRGSGPSFRQCHTGDTITIRQAARLFAVKRVAEYLTGAAKPLRPSDYLHTHKSCFYAAGMVDEFGEQIRKAWAEVDVAALCALDYTHFVKIAKAA